MIYEDYIKTIYACFSNKSDYSPRLGWSILNGLPDSGSRWTDFPRPSISPYRASFSVASRGRKSNPLAMSFADPPSSCDSRPGFFIQEGDQSPEIKMFARIRMYPPLIGSNADDQTTGTAFVRRHVVREKLILQCRSQLSRRAIFLADL